MNSTKSKFLSLPQSLPWLFNDQLDTFAAGDIDGDGRQEIVVSNCPGTSAGATIASPGTAPAIGLLSHFTYGEIEPSWASDQWGQMLTMCTAQAMVPGENQFSDWTLDFTNRFYVGDTDGDGVDEIVVFSPESCSLGVFKWRDQGLKSVFTPFELYNSAPFDYQIFCADIDGDGAAEIVVFMPSTTTFNIFKWSGSSLDIIFLEQAIGGIPLLASDQFFFPAFNKSHGDLKQQVFLFRDANPSCNVFEWNGSTFESIFSQAQISGFSFVADDQFFVGDVDGDHDDELLVYSPSDQEQTLSLLKWQGSGFNLLWSAQGAVSGGYGFEFTLIGLTKIFLCRNGGSDSLLLFNPDLGITLPDSDSLCSLNWQSATSQFSFNAIYDSVLGGRGLSPDNHFLCADVDGNQAQEFIVYHAADSSIPSPSSLTVLEQDNPSFVNEWTASSCALAWNLNSVAAAPLTPFAAFEGTQSDVYKYVSNQCDAGDYNIRGTYNNEADKYSFSGWASTVESNLLLSTPPNNFDMQDWTAVNQELHTELNAVSKVYGLTDARHAMASWVKRGQKEQLAIVKHNVEPAPATDPLINYWPSQLAVAAVWGMATFPFGEDYFLINAAMSMVASLLGSLFSEPQSTPSAVSYYGIKRAIERLYDKYVDKGVTDEATVLKDAVMLPLVGTLVDGPWKCKVTDGEEIAKHAAKPNRLYFYENLIPLSFNIMIWPGVSTPVPAIWKGSLRGGYWQDLGAPGNSFISLSNGDGTYDIYMLYHGGDLLSWENFQFPKSELTDDLFSPDGLAISKDQFFIGKGAWQAIPQLNWTEGIVSNAARQA